MNRPRKFYGWEADGKFFVSIWKRHDPLCRGANVYDSKAAAESECITERTDKHHGAPSIVWDD